MRGEVARRLDPPCPFPQRERGNRFCWRVEDGILIGSGPASHLFTIRDNYKNFRYRVGAKINDHRSCRFESCFRQSALRFAVAPPTRCLLTLHHPIPSS